MKKVLFLLALSFSFTQVFAQWHPGVGGNQNTNLNMGINSITNPNSMFSVNTPGSPEDIMSIYSPSTLNGATGLRIDADASTGFADHVHGLFSTIVSGSGYTYGVRSSAYNPDPSQAGRAYGLWGQAGNATPRANFGIYGRLLGENSGAAIVGVDDINFPGWGGVLPTTDSWAGYFLGDVQVTNNLGVQSVNAPQSMIAANTVGDSRHIVSSYSPSSDNGSAAIYAEAEAATGFADRVSAVNANIESGRGYTIGVRGSAYTPAPSNAGRAYGLWGQAGNATPRTNFGVYGRLLGDNSGAAVIGVDDITYPGWGGILPTNQSWAGYFLGDAQVTERLGIGEEDFSGISTAIGDNDYRLFVNGGIVSKKLLVNSGLPWADYVFDEGYELLTLKKVESHIEAEGHLPAMPSAGEIDEKGGFELGEMTIKQQEKIEEIFLHLIEMDKKLEALEAENEALRVQLTGQ